MANSQEDLCKVESFEEDLVSLIEHENDTVMSTHPLPSLVKPAVPRDVLFGSLFVIHVLIVFAIMYSADSEHIQSKSLANVWILWSTVSGLFWILLFGMGSVRRFVYGCGAMSIFGMSVFGLYWIGQGFMVLGIVVLLLVVKDVKWMISRYNRLEFVIVLLDMVGDIIKENSYLVVVVFMMAVLHCVWASWVMRFMENHGDSNWLVLLYVGFHFYWTTQWIQTCIAFVVSGSVMLWYYGKLDSTAKDSMQPKTVVVHFMKCATSTSFGSICVAALMASWTHVLWNIVRRGNREHATKYTKFLCRDPPQGLRNWIQGYHKYAITHVAAYGQCFHVAAKETWILLEKRGLEAIIDEDITSRIVHFSSTGYICLLSSFLSVFVVSDSFLISIVYLLVAFNTMCISTQLVISTVKTLHICFAENPARLNDLNPTMYNRLVRISELKKFKDENTERV